jgi:hypothetical protein
MLDSSMPVETRSATVARDMDEAECLRRNALTKSKPGFRLQAGDRVAVVETFGGEAFLVEVAGSRPDEATWMGVVYPAEIRLV